MLTIVKPFMKNKLIILTIVVLTTACTARLHQTISFNSNSQSKVNSQKDSLALIVSAYNTANTINEQLPHLKGVWFSIMTTKWKFFNRPGRVGLLRSDSAKFDFVPIPTFKINENDIVNYKENQDAQGLLQLDSTKCDIYIMKEKKFVGDYSVELIGEKWQPGGGWGDLSEGIANLMNSYIGKGNFIAIQLYHAPYVDKVLGVYINKHIYVLDSESISPLSANVLSVQKDLALIQSRKGIKGRDF